MRKCLYEKCQFPNCERTCGLSLEELIVSLQSEIQKLTSERKTMLLYFTNINQYSKLSMDKFNTYENEMREHCKEGYCDCVNNPWYLRKFHSDYWKEIGMPTKCAECYYENEDK